MVMQTSSGSAVRQNVGFGPERRPIHRRCVCRYEACAPVILSPPVVHSSGSLPTLLDGTALSEVFGFVVITCKRIAKPFVPEGSPGTAVAGREALATIPR